MVAPKAVPLMVPPPDESITVHERVESQNELLPGVLALMTGVSVAELPRVITPPVLLRMTSKLVPAPDVVRLASSQE